MTNGLWYLDNHVTGIRALAVVWGRITTASGRERAERDGHPSAGPSVGARAAPRCQARAGSGRPQRTGFCTSCSPFPRARTHGPASVLQGRDGAQQEGPFSLQACGSSGPHFRLLRDRAGRPLSFGQRAIVPGSSMVLSYIQCLFSNRHLKKKPGKILEQYLIADTILSVHTHFLGEV